VVKTGLIGKLPGFDIIDVSDRVGDRTTKRTVYRLDGWNPLGGFDAVVRLRDTLSTLSTVKHSLSKDAKRENNNSSNSIDSVKQIGLNNTLNESSKKELPKDESLSSLSQDLAKSAKRAKSDSVQTCEMLNGCLTVLNDLPKTGKIERPTPTTAKTKLDLGLILIVDDVPAFVGTDGQKCGLYAKGDLVSAPVTQCDILIAKGKATPTTKVAE